MAASATNTSREMGAVFGVAILGSIVNAKLTGDLAARLKAIGIPPNFQSLVVHAVQTGGASGGAAGAPSTRRTPPSPTSPTKVVNAAYDAFGSGLHEALVLSGCLILVGAVVAARTIHRRAKETLEVSLRSAATVLAVPARSVVGPTAAATSEELGTFNSRRSFWRLPPSAPDGSGCRPRTGGTIRSTNPANTLPRLCCAAMPMTTPGWRRRAGGARWAATASTAAPRRSRCPSPACAWPRPRSGPTPPGESIELRHGRSCALTSGRSPRELGDPLPVV